MEELTIRELKIDDLEDAALLLGRGMRNNPNNVQAFGQDQRHRERALARMFLSVLRRTHTKGKVFGAFGRRKMVGVCATTAPQQCRLNVLEKLRIVPAILLGNSLGTPLRILHWVGEWSRRDPSDPPWHLGPVAGDSHLHSPDWRCHVS